MGSENITVRMLMVAKEVGGIIGKGGETIKNFREESGSKINISSEQNCPERVLSITGGQTQIYKAVELISEKLHKDINSGLTDDATNKVPVTIRLVVPASQCGSIIGKGGSKINEIRDTTGCAIQVQSEMLPNSSERSVTLSGAPSTIVHCINLLCDVMIQFPAKTATVPYQPHVPMMQSNSFMSGGQFSMPPPPMFRRQQKRGSFGGFGGGDRDGSETAGDSYVNLPARMVNTNTQELTVPDEFIGYIIGKGGSRIKEIRQISGASIQIQKKSEQDGEDGNNMDTNDSNENPADRKVILQGAAESICFAQYLINISVQTYGRRNKKSSDSFSSDDPISQSPRNGLSGGKDRKKMNREKFHPY